MLLSWWEWLQTESGYDVASVELFDGTNWTPIYTASGIVSTEWVEYSLLLDPSYAVANFRMRFRLQSDSTVTYPGFYVDDLLVTAISDAPPTIPCVPLPGGLVVGNTYDGNTGVGLNGARVSREDGKSVLSTATPDDPAVDDGFYTLFSPAGSQTFSASMRNYATDIQTPTVVLSDTIRQDFNLPAGWLSYTPDMLETTLPMGASTTLTFDLSNSGGLPASFELREQAGGQIPAQVQRGAPEMRIPGNYPTGSLLSQLRAQAAPKRPVPLPDVLPWVTIANYPIPIMDNTAAEMDGLVYSVAGIDGSSSNLTNSLYIYDPASGGWSSGASLADMREKPAAAFVEGLLYVVGGWDNFGSPDPKLEVYDPGTNTWTTGASIPTAYAAATAVSLGGQLYVIGGCDSFSCGSTDVFRYDPAGGCLDAHGALPGSHILECLRRH